MPLSRSLGPPAPLVNIAAVAVILASLTAIGAVTGLIPSAFSSMADYLAAQGGPSIAAAQQSVHPRDDGRLAAASGQPCRQCGVVEAVRQVQIKGHGISPGAVSGDAGGSIVASQFGRGHGRGAIGAIDTPWGGYAGPEVDNKTRTATSFRVVVRMEDGSTRTVYQAAAPTFGVGGKVRVVNGMLAGRG